MKKIIREYILFSGKKRKDCFFRRFLGLSPATGKTGKTGKEFSPLCKGL
jgi:hypothetical protein